MADRRHQTGILLALLTLAAVIAPMPALAAQTRPTTAPVPDAGDLPRDWGAWDSLLSTTTREATAPVTSSLDLEPHGGGLAIRFRLPVRDRCRGLQAEVEGSETLHVLRVGFETERLGRYCPAVTAAVDGELRIPRVPAGEWTIVVRPPAGTARRFDTTVYD